MKAFQGGFKVAFLCFFISHIPITILLDSQAVTNRFHPYAYQFLVKWYCETFGDFLMREDAEEVWFSTMVMGEVFFQLPFFFVAIKQLNKYAETEDASYPEWFRAACLIYGSHVSTTLIPILGTFLTSGDKMTTLQRCMTVAIYSPYLIFPFMLLCFAAAEDFFPEKVEVSNRKEKSS
jgi:hypothetical protein